MSDDIRPTAYIEYSDDYDEWQLLDTYDKRVIATATTYATLQVVAESYGYTVIELEV